MKELHRITEIIKSIPNTAVITDGRFSGASGGLSIGYLCPEAAEGGPIALLKDGDKIKVDLYKGIIHADITDAELAEREKNWKPLVREEEKGLLGRYAKSVNSARTGATLKK
jgi:dihydroxy-acid dehydratase